MAYSAKQKQKIFDEICDLIVNGMSLRSALLKCDDLPAKTFFVWLREDEFKGKQYARATMDRSDAIFEEMFDIADDGTNDYMTRKNAQGEDYEVVNTENIQRSRLRVESRKWALARMQPKKYSETAVQLAAEKPDDSNENEFLKTTLLLRDSIINDFYVFLEQGFDWSILEGGSRSGKTYNFLKWAYLQTRLGKFDLNIIAPSHKMLEQGAFSDIKKILSEYAPDIHIPERATKLNLYGSEWVFEVVTSESEAKRNRKNVFANECDGISEIIANLLGRASGRKFADYNPVKKFWVSNKINETETNILRTNWTKNPYLTENQLQWFADLKKNGEFAEDGSPEKYAYDVYYLGNYSLLSGKAYELSDFDIVEEVPEKFDYMISYSDPSLGVGADYFASLLFGIKNNIVYVVDCIFSQFAKTAGFLEQLKAWDNQYGKIIDHYAEKNGTSGVVTRAAKEMYDGVLIEVSNGDKKEADIIVYSTTAKKFKYKKSGKMLSFIEQCVDFPNNEHDDAPDCLARGAKILMKNFDI